MSTRQGGLPRVALVIGQLTHGGSERQLFELAVRLRKVGYEPLVYCLSDAQEPYGSLLRQADVKVVIIKRKRRFELSRARRLSRALVRDRVDVVHSFLFAANSYAALAARMAGIEAFLPSVRSAEVQRGFFSRLVDKYTFFRAPLVLVNSSGLAQWVVSSYGLKSETIRIVPNGLDLRRFVPVRPLHAGRNGDALIGSVSLLKKEKRVPQILEIAERLVRERPGTRFRIVGDGPERETILNLRKKMGLEGVVELPGATEDVGRHLAQFDIFLLASEREGMPNAVIEAMGAARPVVASDVIGTSEVVNDGVTGLLYPADEPGVAVEALRNLVDDPGLASRMGQEGRKLVQERYSVEKMVKKTVDVYQELLC